MAEMDNSIIGVMNTGFVISLSFAILFFIITVILAFVFDIKTIFFMRTGRAQAKTVNEMKKANANTGRLRVDGKTMTSKLDERSKKKGRAPAVTPPPQNEKKAPAPAPAPQASEGAAETDVLSAPVSEPGGSYDNQTTVLNASEEASRTNENLSELKNAENTSADIHFVVTKEIVLTHTDEII